MTIGQDWAGAVAANCGLQSCRQSWLSLKGLVPQTPPARLQLTSRGRRAGLPGLPCPTATAPPGEPPFNLWFDNE